MSSAVDVYPPGPVQLYVYAPGGLIVIRMAPLKGALHRSLSTTKLVMDGVTEISFIVINAETVHPLGLCVTFTE